MARPVVLLAVPMAEDRRRIAQETLGSLAEIVVRSDIDDAALERLAPEVDVLVTGGFPRDITDAAWDRMTRLKLLQTLAAGVDHLPYDRIPGTATIASNAGAHRIAIGEHSIALLLAAAKNVVRHTEAIRAGKFPQDLMGRSVRGKTLGVIGLGGIGGGGGPPPGGRRAGGGGGHPPRGRRRPPPGVGG